MFFSEEELCTGPNVHFFTLAYAQLQLLLRQKFTLCFPESVCCKNMEVDMKRPST